MIIFRFGVNQILSSIITLNAEKIQFTQYSFFNTLYSLLSKFYNHNNWLLFLDKLGQIPCCHIVIKREFHQAKYIPLKNQSQ